MDLKLLPRETGRAVMYLASGPVLGGEGDVHWPCSRGQGSTGSAGEDPGTLAKPSVGCGSVPCPSHPHSLLSGQVGLGRKNSAVEGSRLSPATQQLCGCTQVTSPPWGPAASPNKKAGLTALSRSPCRSPVWRKAGGSWPLCSASKGSAVGSGRPGLLSPGSLSPSGPRASLPALALCLVPPAVCLAAFYP